MNAANVVVTALAQVNAGDIISFYGGAPALIVSITHFQEIAPTIHYSAFTFLPVGNDYEGEPISMGLAPSTKTTIHFPWVEESPLYWTNSDDIMSTLEG